MTSDSLHYAVLDWLANGETGISSKTIAFTVLGIQYDNPFRSCHPWDPADLRRCVDLLKRIPELRRHLDKVRGVSSVWNDLIERWDELEALLEREMVFGNRAPETYALMQEIIGDRR